MDNTKQAVSDAPGVEEPSIDFIEKALVRDLSVCAGLLNAILSDKELRLYLATFMQGRWVNAKHGPSEVDKAQTDLFAKNGK